MKKEKITKDLEHYDLWGMEITSTLTRAKPLTLKELETAFDEIIRMRARMLKKTAREIVAWNYRIIEDTLLPNGFITVLVAKDIFQEVQKSLSVATEKKKMKQ